MSFLPPRTTLTAEDGALKQADLNEQGSVRRRRTVLATAAGIALCAAALAGAGAAVAATNAHTASPALTKNGVWQKAIEVPGSAALNVGNTATINSVSCAIGGTCAAGGYYTDSSLHEQAMVDDETGGKFDAATEVPGIATLNAGGTARVVSVSCAAAGECGIGGYYTDSSGDIQAFVDSETGGVWGTAEEVPGLATLNADGRAQITSVSCAAFGRGSAGGFYADSSGDQQAFVVSETGAGWTTAVEVPGTASLNVGGSAAISSISCRAAGACSAGGYYASASGDGIPSDQAFVVNEAKGAWGTAEEVPGTASLNTGAFAQINSVSCAAVGACSAGGWYETSQATSQAFVVNEANGIWGNAKQVPGSLALNKTGFAQVTSVACATVGNCIAGGFYQDSTWKTQAYIVTETNGIWGTAEEAPGTAALDTGTAGASTSGVSCGGVGNCSVAGYYNNEANDEEVFVLSENKGVWGTAEEIPNTNKLNTGAKATVGSISCPTTNACTLGGQYTVGANAAIEAFVVRETKGS
jgi:hypothetical protein